MIANLTLRALVEGSRLPSVTWEQSGNSAEKINQYWKGNVMKRILAVIVFFAAATSLALGQTADKQEKTKGTFCKACHGTGHLKGRSSTILA